MEPTTIYLNFLIMGNVALFGFWMNSIREKTDLSSALAEGNLREKLHLKQLKDLRSGRQEIADDMLNALIHLSREGCPRAQIGGQLLINVLNALSQIIREDRALNAEAWPVDSSGSSSQLDSFFGPNLPRHLLSKRVVETRQQLLMDYNEVMATFPRDIEKYFARLEVEAFKSA